MISEERKLELRASIANRVSKHISKRDIFGDALQEVMDRATEEEKEFLYDLGYVVKVY